MRADSRLLRDPCIVRVRIALLRAEAARRAAPADRDTAAFAALMRVAVRRVLIAGDVQVSVHIDVHTLAVHVVVSALLSRRSFVVSSTLFSL